MRAFYFPPDDPLAFEAGDTLRITCDWDNDTDETITFPREMCVLSAYTLASDDLRCIGGIWI